MNANKGRSMPVRLPYSYVFLIWEWRWKDARAA